MVKIDFDDEANKRSFLAWLIAHGTTHIPKEDFGKIRERMNKDGLDVKLVCNGIEIPLQEVCKDWEEAVEKTLANQAKQKASEIIGERMDKINRKLEIINDTIMEQFPDVNFEDEN